jgi:hypothetical protein
MRYAGSTTGPVGAQISDLSWVAIIPMNSTLIILSVLRGSSILYAATERANAFNPAIQYDLSSPQIAYRALAYLNNAGILNNCLAER